ncbi:MAG: aldo/keto reductase [Pseudonocardiaceae bacterium]|nr:aldo/keto reductase [Pseudonocardiaceae bacterium]
MTGAADRLGIGLAALGRPAYINLGRGPALPAERDVAAMREATWQVLDRAYQLGIRWIDVARSYGRAEEFLAGWLSAREPADITVSSKWGYAYVGDWRIDTDTHEVKEHSVERFRLQRGESWRLLGDAIDVYQVHSLTVDSPIFGDEALLAELADLTATGVRLGFSTSGPRQADTIRRALELDVDGERLFGAVQSTWNPLEPSAGAALAAAHTAGVHVLVKESLANGRLVAEPPTEVSEIAERHHAGTDAVALAATLRQPWADTVLLGPASVAQLTANVAALRLELTEDELAALGGLAEPPDTYWARRAALTWQ